MEKKLTQLEKLHSLECNSPSGSELLGKRQEEVSVYHLSIRMHKSALVNQCQQCRFRDHSEVTCAFLPERRFGPSIYLETYKLPS